MRFVKDEFFKLGARRFKILTGMVFLPNVPNYAGSDNPNTGHPDILGCILLGTSLVEFVELTSEKELGETTWIETGNPIIKTKRYLYELISKGELILE